MSLPNGYIQLSYIESTGTQYIDTQVPVKATTGFEAEFAATYTTETAIVAGGFTWDGYNHQFYAHSAGVWIEAYGSGQEYGFGTTDTNKHTVSHNVPYGTLVFDGQTIKDDLVFYDNTDRTFHMFCMDGGEGRETFGIGSLKIYACKFYDNGNKIRDYVPCIHPSGEVGLYDLVNQEFYGNAGTGEFVAGDEVAGRQSLGMAFARRRLMAIKKEPKYEWAVYTITKAIDESAGGTNTSLIVSSSTAAQAAKSYTVSSNGKISLTNSVSTRVYSLKAGDYLVGITDGATNTATTGSVLYKVRSVSTTGLMKYNVSYTQYSPKDARGTDTGLRVGSDTLDYPVDGKMGSYWYVLIKGDV